MFCIYNEGQTMKQSIYLNSRYITAARLYDWTDYDKIEDVKVIHKKGDEIKRGFFGRLFNSTQKRYNEDILQDCFGHKYSRSEFNKLVLEIIGDNQGWITLLHGHLYRKPKVVFTLTDKQSYTKFFDSYEECVKFVEEQHIDYIKIEYA